MSDRIVDSNILISPILRNIEITSLYTVSESTLCTRMIARLWNSEYLFDYLLFEDWFSYNFSKSIGLKLFIVIVF